MHILLHICCANCAIYPLQRLREATHRVTGFFYNHNIHPYQEYRKRLETTRQYAHQAELPVIFHEPYQLETFLGNVASKPQDRCSYCYRSRLLKTAQEAKEQRAEGFTTTLLYSRYQNHQAIVDYGHELATEYNLVFHYEDYREGWNQGIQQSKNLGLYRQQYCGCIYSERDRYEPRQS